ncbi:hypothetical protein [Acaryochloris marina]|uniref:Uncharacterized protein n=1 Tax=Acaryochloris marina (strain MBIC 11017) TaxID=329726 RepID=B0C4W3_ACAM1|nr:hypothetical protein [Acaryochloris marina]ABW31101.1 hypothetical protein AM1_6169 [Acaryochloris marina MBIC11017]BDM79808.1 hypothetical protein AM10699_26760 [Acaryochloris marina MBIC10699]
MSDFEVQREKLEHLYYLLPSFLSDELIEAGMESISSEAIEEGNDLDPRTNIESSPTVLDLIGEAVELWVLKRGGDD